MSRRCPTCNARYEGRLRRCPLDGSELTAAPDRFLGGTLGDGALRLTELLGCGSVARVYRGVAQDQPDRAVKILDEALAGRPGSRQRFLREAQATAKLDHPNVIRLYGVGEAESGIPYLVMELLPGRALSQVLTGRGLPLKRALTLAGDLAAALAHAHGAGVVHRDVKPANVFAGRRTVLTDFGLARVRGEPGLTHTGEILGTPAYMAPEQIETGEVGPASDVYALGCLLFELLSGRPPFVGSAASVIDQQVEREPNRASAQRHDVPKSIDQLLGAMLRKPACERPCLGEVVRSLTAK